MREEGKNTKEMEKRRCTREKKERDKGKIERRTGIEI
jgi:hypothetical protein